MAAAAQDGPDLTVPLAASLARPEVYRWSAAAGKGRRRGLSAGYDPGRLPIRVAPRLGESPASWLTRSAARYGLTPRQLLRIVSPSRITSERTLRDLLHEHRHRLADLFALTAGEIAGLVALPAVEQARIGYWRRYRAQHGAATTGVPVLPGLPGRAGPALARRLAQPAHLGLRRAWPLPGGRLPRLRGAPAGDRVVAGATRRRLVAVPATPQPGSEEGPPGGPRLVRPRADRRCAPARTRRCPGRAAAARPPRRRTARTQSGPAEWTPPTGSCSTRSWSWFASSWTMTTRSTHWTTSRACWPPRRPRCCPSCEPPPRRRSGRPPTTRGCCTPADYWRRSDRPPAHRPTRNPVAAAQLASLADQLTPPAQLTFRTGTAYLAYPTTRPMKYPRNPPISSRMYSGPN